MNELDGPHVKEYGDMALAACSYLPPLLFTSIVIVMTLRSTWPLAVLKKLRHFVYVFFARETPLSTNPDIIEEVLQHCDLDTMKTAKAVSRAWQERGTALLRSDEWLARHVDLRTQLLGGAPHSGMLARMRERPHEAKLLADAEGPDEAVDEALRRVWDQAHEGNSPLMDGLLEHIGPGWLPQVLLNELATSLAKKAWLVQPAGGPTEGEEEGPGRRACRGCKFDRYVHPLPDGSKRIGSASIWAPIDVSKHPFRRLKPQFRNPLTQAVGFFSFTTFEHGDGSAMPCAMAVVWGRGSNAQAVALAPEDGPVLGLQMGNLRGVVTARPSCLRL